MSSGGSPGSCSTVAGGLDRGRLQREVADDVRVAGGDVGRAGPLVGECALREVLVQGGVAAGEPGDVVGRCEGLEPQRGLVALERARGRGRRGERGDRLGLARELLAEGRPGVVRQDEARLVRQGVLGRADAAAAAVLPDGARQLAHTAVLGDVARPRRSP